MSDYILATWTPVLLPGDYFVHEDNVYVLK